jgi:hypothetical protein
VSGDNVAQHYEEVYIETLPKAKMQLFFFYVDSLYEYSKVLFFLTIVYVGNRKQ